MIDPDTLDFDKGGGLIPVVVQDAATLQVLTLAYLDRAALDETIASGEATFFSRSRGGRWRKGETSGDRLQVVAITPGSLSNGGSMHQKHPPAKVAVATDEDFGV